MLVFLDIVLYICDRNLFGTMKDKIIRTLLVLLGFGSASCGSIDKAINGGHDGGFGGAVAEYAAPMVVFSVKGRVVDAQDRPVNGISVTVETEDGWYVGEDFATHSGDDGCFEGRVEFGGYGVRYTVHFSDIDGEDNGGLFADKEISITVTEDDKVDKTAWTTGYLKDMGDVKLEKVE